MSNQIPGAGARWSMYDEDDVIYYLRESEGDLGACSSHQAMVDLAMSGIPTGGNLSQKTFAQMRVKSPAAREAKVRALMRAIGPDHARVLARYYGPRLPPALKPTEGKSDEPYAGRPPTPAAVAAEAAKAWDASVPARLNTLAVLTHEANDGHAEAYAEARLAAIDALPSGFESLRGEIRTRALLMHPEVASVEAWLEGLRLRAAAGPDKREAALVLGDVGFGARRLLSSAQGAYAMARKAYVEPWRPSPRAAAFVALFEVEG